MKILAINPGSTTTKISLYENEKCIFVKNIEHSSEYLSKFDKIIEQKNFRIEEVKKAIKENEISIDEIDVFVGRGGLVRPIASGTYKINDALIKDLEDGYMGEHASNLGGLIAYELGSINNKNNYIVDPVVVDELDDVARITGLKGIERKSIFHALNQKAVAKRYAKEVNKQYNELTLIVAHMGGGISVGLHKNGRVIETNNALGGDGPFSPERAGVLPMFEFLKYAKNMPIDEINKSIKGAGGLVDYFKTSDVREVEKLKLKGNKESDIVLEAMAYSIAKEIGAFATVASGKVEQIILTGGVAYSEYITSYIEEKVGYICGVTRYPGEDEMEALTLGALRVELGEETVKEYIVK